MVQNIKQGNIFGRIGSGIGKGLADQIPKEIERTRLASGLKDLGEQKNMTPFQQFSGLVSQPGVTPQIVQSGTDLLRQQSIIDNYRNQVQNQTANNSPSFQPSPIQNQERSSATTIGSTDAALNPYIPPSGPELENLARQKMASEPQVYPTIDAARSAVSNEIAGNIQQSNARLQKRNLEEDVQNKAETALRNEISLVGAKIPGTVLSNLQQQAVDDVRTKKLTPEQAKVKYGKLGDEISESFSDISSWGGLGLITKSPKSLISSISSIQKKAREYGFQKQAADALIAENGLTPQFAYASMYPVNEIKPLNDEIKALPNILPKIEKAPGVPGLAGIGRSRPRNANAEAMTLEVSPRLARSMGTEGSPLSIGYELDKKGYDSQVWKDYLTQRQDELNLSSNQVKELGKPQPSFFGWMNDLWLKSFSGVK